MELSRFQMAARLGLAAWGFYSQATAEDSPGGQEITLEELAGFMENTLNDMLVQSGVQGQKIAVTVIGDGNNG